MHAVHTAEIRAAEIEETFSALLGAERGPRGLRRWAGSQAGSVPRGHWLAPRAALSMFAPRGSRAAVAAAATAHCAKPRPMSAGPARLASASFPSGSAARLTGPGASPSPGRGPSRAGMA